MTTPTSSKILEGLEDRLLLQVVTCYLDRGTGLGAPTPYESAETGFAEHRIARLHAHDWTDVADAPVGDRFRRAMQGLVERELVTRVVLDPSLTGADDPEGVALVRPTRAGLKRADYLHASRTERLGLWWSEHWHLVAIPALVSLVVSAVTVSLFR